MEINDAEDNIEEDFETPQRLGYDDEVEEDNYNYNKLQSKIFLIYSEWNGIFNKIIN